jgi:hypothetical protein
MVCLGGAAGAGSFRAGMEEGAIGTIATHAGTALGKYDVAKARFVQKRVNERLAKEIRLSERARRR